MSNKVTTVLGNRTRDVHGCTGNGPLLDSDSVFSHNTTLYYKTRLKASVVCIVSFHGARYALYLLE